MPGVNVVIKQKITLQRIKEQFGADKAKLKGFNFLGKTRNRSQDEPDFVTDQRERISKVRREDLKTNLQLNRKLFFRRIQLEDKIYRNSSKYVCFIVLVLTFIGTITSYDPTHTMNDLHRILRKRFKFDDQDVGPPSITTPMDVMVYTQLFIEATYEMASAMVDANTLTDIDVERCFAKDVNDVCRLAYWKLPRNRNNQNYVNFTRIFYDKLAKTNSETVLSCKNSPTLSNCINRSDPIHIASGSRRSFGLTPEDPVIFDSLMDYPLRSVVPLSPVVWQTRTPPVPCSGFGNTYNDELLGAGACSADISCDPAHVTEFDNTPRSIASKRKQNIYVTYEEAVFACNDRDKDAESFKDKSWYPWITYRDAKFGREMSKTPLRSESVYYKFITDVAYLQAPFSQYFLVVDSSTLYNLTASNCANSLSCDPSDPHGAKCQDPVANEHHLMWREKNEHPFYPCTYHSAWSQKFLENDVTKRMNTFFTFETNKFFVAALIITPFGADFPDIMTLCMVEVFVDQAGYISTYGRLLSTAQTMNIWYWRASICLAVCLGLLLIGLYELVFVKREMESLVDVLLAVMTGIYVTAVMVNDNMPPNPTEELLASLLTNTQEAYFHTISDVLQYSSRQDHLRNIGFLLTTLLLLRFQHMLGDHPKLSRLTFVLTVAGDDMIHFFVLLFTNTFLLGVVAWWSFGADADAYHAPRWAFYKLFRMFVGDADALFDPSDSVKPLPIKQLMFLVMFVFLIFFCLVNFFLAIIVNTYTAVNYESKGAPVNNIFADIIDICFRVRYRCWCRKSPSPPHVLAYLKGPGRGVKESAAVTSDELFNLLLLPSGKPVFLDIEAAREFVRYYHHKNSYRLAEYREAVMFVAGSYWSPEHEEVEPTHRNVAGELLSACEKVQKDVDDINADIQELQMNRPSKEDWNLVFHHPSSDAPNSPRYLESGESLSPLAPLDPCDDSNANGQLDMLELDPHILGERLRQAREENLQLHNELMQFRTQARTMEILAASVSKKSLCNAIVSSEVQRLETEIHAAEHNLHDMRGQALKQETYSIPANGQDLQLSQESQERLSKQTQLRYQLLAAELKTQEGIKLLDLHNRDSQFKSSEADKLLQQLKDLENKQQQLLPELNSSREVVMGLEKQLVAIEDMRKKPVQTPIFPPSLGKFRMCS